MLCPLARVRFLAVAFVAGVGSIVANAPAQSAEPERKPPAEIRLLEALILPPAGQGGRLALPEDAVAGQMAAGTWKAPHAGDTLARPDGSTWKWEPLKAADDDSFHHAALRGGYAYFAVPAEEQRVMILEAAGHVMVYVNGEPRTGDPYSHGYVHLPILLWPGTNHLLFRAARGSLRAALVAPRPDAQLDLSDTTTPDLLVGEEVRAEAAVMVLNATNDTLDKLFLRAETVAEGRSAVTTELPPILPLGTRKVGFRLPGQPPTAEGTRELKLTLQRQVGDRLMTLHEATLKLAVLRPEQTHKVTFRSGIDGSVQYYSVVPRAATNDNPPAERAALILTLHGAAVEGSGQAACFSPKSWAHVVAPTNRRPYGFDWEDWGRLDAMEVLERAQETLDTNPRRTYLTGHSMGGHGTWHLGATFPDRFAAIGPSAGWISFWSYTGALKIDKPLPAQELLLRSLNPSDTLALAHNYGHYGVYVLHGDKDDNVPVGQARSMRLQLAGFHPDFVYHEQSGAGHWWGNPCVDWKPMMDFFQDHLLPRREDVRQVDFVTASPGVSAHCDWASIEAQVLHGKHSSIHLQCDREQRRLNGTTSNVARLALDVGHLAPGKPVQVELDGQKVDKVAWPAEGTRLWLQRQGEKWSAIKAPLLTDKRPQRYGPFKSAFRNRMVFVYGTKGTPEENAWALAKARFDAETFWYRGNGSVDVVADTSFDPAAERDRNVILYGHSNSNVAWRPLLSESPVQVRRGRIAVGDREMVGEDLACLFLRPRPGSDRAAVAVVGGSGIHGMRLTDRLPYFSSGVGYPDCLVFGSDVVTQRAENIRAAGFFGLDWSVSSGEFAWR